MLTLRHTLPLALALALSGCNTTTSIDKATIYYDRSDYPVHVVRDLPEITDPILQHGRCVVQIATPGANLAPNTFCTFALTKDQLFVQSWDSSKLKYNNILTIEFTQLKTVDLASFVTMKQIKLEEKQRLVAFSVIVDDGGYIDGAATKNIYQRLQTRGIASSGNDDVMKTPAPPTTFIPIIIPR